MDGIGFLMGMIVGSMLATLFLASLVVFPGFLLAKLLKKDWNCWKAGNVIAVLAVVSQLPTLNLFGIMGAAMAWAVTLHFSQKWEPEN